MKAKIKLHHSPFLTQRSSKHLPVSIRWNHRGPFLYFYESASLYNLSFSLFSSEIE